MPKRKLPRQSEGRNRLNNALADLSAVFSIKYHSLLIWLIETEHYTPSEVGKGAKVSHAQIYKDYAKAKKGADNVA